MLLCTAAVLLMCFLYVNIIVQMQRYSMFSDQSKHKKLTLAKKIKQRNKDRQKMSIFLVIIFISIFVLILLAEIFYINENTGTPFILKGWKPEYDPLTDAEYIIEEKKSLESDGNLEIDSYRRKELSVMRRDNFDILRRDVDQMRISTRIKNKENLSFVDKNDPNSRDKDSWLKNDGYIEYFNASSRSTDAQWYPVHNIYHKFFVYSAYYDDRKGRIIRVIGVTQTRKGEKVLCKYWYSNSTSLIVNGAVKIIRENWNLKYSACFIACPLTISKNGKQPIPPPESVSIITSLGGYVTNKLYVHDTDNVKNSIKDEFALCVKPLHYNYRKTFQITEFLELNRILGVKHFTFYNHTISRAVKCVLNHYIDSEVVQILSWDLKIESQKEVRTEGLFAALNDCLYRYMYRYRYVIMIDLDEYVVPHAFKKLREMIDFFSPKKNFKKVGALSFRNSFFYLQWPDDPDSASLPPLVTLRKTGRKQQFHPQKQRSKFIAVNPHVVEAGNHFVWEFIPGKSTLNVPTEVGFLHHYRVCEFGGDDCVRMPKLTDHAMYRYKDELVTRFTEKLNNFTENCQLEVTPGEGD